MIEPRLRAFVVTEPCEGRACVRFATHAIVARREGASELDNDFESVECRRAPEFDSEAPGPVPPLTLLDHGWWFECIGCNIRITADGETEDADGNPVAVSPVADGEGVFCTPTCRHDWFAEREESKRREIAAIAAMVNEVCRLFPGILLEGRPHAYVSRRSDSDYRWWSEEQVIVPFSFPGSQHGLAQFRRERNGVSGVLIPQGDLDAWKQWRAGLLR